jgi:hypothetical protein
VKSGRVKIQTTEQRYAESLRPDFIEEARHLIAHRECPTCGGSGKEAVLTGDGHRREIPCTATP